ncbi:MAG TPA: hypothetical protein DCL48_09450, partial [Alphaproteobacteria bacterium]|nr:hypothetical protein [Alphaproteobacteria bacterium]
MAETSSLCPQHPQQPLGLCANVVWAGADPFRGIHRLPLVAWTDRANVKHLSTRGLAPHLSFDDIVLSGLAPDGGLYVPEVWPQLSPKQFNDFADQRYGQVAEAVLSALGGSETALDLNGAIAGAYAQFRHPEVAPLRPLAPNLWMLELFHGPTFAFKDFALQLLGPLMAQRLERESRRLTVL